MVNVLEYLVHNLKLQGGWVVVDLKYGQGMSVVG
jgi:hypothetical protein